MKINIVPDMVEMVTAKDSQKKVSEIDYRLHLHEWICHPDLQVNSHVRKVTDQISDVSLLLMQGHPPRPARPPWRGADSPVSPPQPSPRIARLPTHRSDWNSKVSWRQGSVCQCFHGTLGLTAFCLGVSFHRVNLGPDGVHVFGVQVTVKFYLTNPLHLF